jgi:hypothetical protein
MVPRPVTTTRRFDMIQLPTLAGDGASTARAARKNDDISNAEGRDAAPAFARTTRPGLCDQAATIT